MGESTVRVPPGQQLVIQDDLGGQIPKIEDGPWPAFPADLTSIAVVTATQAHGTVLVFEKMFESRLFFVDKLVGMGARIILCDPHRVVVTGPAQLYGERLTSPDIRAGMAMLIAALCAEGTSTIGNVGEIDRGYERIDERLRGLGARDRARRGLARRAAGGRRRHAPGRCRRDRGHGRRLGLRHRGRDVEDAVAELGVPAAPAGGGLLEDRRDLRCPSCGFAAQTSAAAPATCGAANDVPLA